MTHGPSQKFTPSDATGKCWYARGKIVETSIHWLIDTGASPNVLDLGIYLNLPTCVRSPLRQSKTSYQSADGSALNVYGETELEVNFYGQKVMVTMVIADLGTLQGILGMQFLEEYQCTLDLTHGYVRSPIFDIRLFKNEDSGCFSLRLKEKLVIEPGYEIVASSEFDVESWPKDETLALIEPNSDFGAAGLLVPRALVKVGSKIGITIANVSEKVVVLQTGSQVGNLVSIDEILDERATISSITNDTSTSDSVFPEHLQPLLDQASLTLSPAETFQVKQMLIKFKDVFVGPDGNLGRTSIVKHQIDTGDHRPIKQAPRRLPLAQKQAAEQEIENMLEKGIIEPSESAWSSPIVLVTKKDKSVRFCVDYRKLNLCTKKDAYPLPNISDCLDSLSGSRYFSTLDLASGYWQVEMDETDKHKTAFVTHKGLFQFKVLPFGLTNAPATFERLMELILRGLQWERCLVYLDDIISFGKNFQDCLDNLSLVFQKLRSAQLKLKPSKCSLFQERVKFLGHIVSPDGIECDPEKICDVDKWPVPKNVTDVRSFLGLASYYRRFIPCFAQLASPLTSLTKKNQTFEWTSECQVAFDSLKDQLVTSPILAYPSRELEHEFVLDTDASDYGLGAVLSQKINGEEKVIAYASRTMNSAQRNYCTTYKELLAVVTFTQHFRHYLIGRHFTIRTDHSSLRWLQNFRNIEGMVGRWLTALSPFDFTIEHRKGLSHQNADTLSRNPVARKLRCGRPECPECPEDTVVTPKHVRIATHNNDNICPVTRSQTLPLNADTSESDSNVSVQDENTVTPEPETPVPSNWIETWSLGQLKEWQWADPDLRKVIEFLEQGMRPKPDTLIGQPVEVRCLCAIWKTLVLKDGILYRTWHHRHDPSLPKTCIVAPKKLREEIFEHLHCHKTAGHLGIKRTLEKVRDRFFWPMCKSDIQRWCKECEMCSQVKPGVRHRAKLTQIPVSAPLDRIAIDILGELSETDNGNKYILVLSDYFTKWTEAYPLPDQTAQSVADVIVTQFVSRFGVPRQIHSDQGRNFESNLFSEMCKLLGVTKTRTTPYRPQSDGQVERFNRTLLQMLRTLVSEAQNDWDDLLPYVTMAYRSTIHDSTGCSPNLLMLGREINLPLDVMVGCPASQTVHYECSTEYVEWLRKTMYHVHNFARDQLQNSAQRQKTLYDKHCKPLKYHKGQYVWRYYPPTAKQKLGKGWVGPYRVLSCPTHIHCDIALSPADRCIRVHVDHLKPHLGKVPQTWEGYESSDAGTSDFETGNEHSPRETETSSDSGSESCHSDSDNVISDNQEPCDQAMAGDDDAPQARRSQRPRRPVQRMDL